MFRFLRLQSYGDFLNHTSFFPIFFQKTEIESSNKKCERFSSSVLSIKYKLYGIGIDMDKTGPLKAAVLAEGRDLSSGKKNNPVKNELIWLEHRRWMAEKLCLGWRRICDLEECVESGTKDERAKRHVCLLPSRPDQMLAAQFSEGSRYGYHFSDEDFYLYMLAHEYKHFSGSGTGCDRR